MTQRIRTILVALGIAIALAGGAWSVQAQTEKHPVLRNSIRQLEGIKDRLQRAPSDFGGHRVAAIGAINHAMSELNEAIAFDRK